MCYINVHSYIKYGTETISAIETKSASDTCVIILPGVGGSKTGKEYIFKNFVDYLAGHNISFFRFDYIGTGESSGVFSEQLISKQVDEVKFIYDYCKESLGYKKIIFLPISIGSIIVSITIDKYQLDVEKVIHWNPSLNIEKYSSGLEVEKDKVILGGLFLNQSYLIDLSKLKINDSVFTKCPTFFIQGSNDFSFEDEYISSILENHEVVNISIDSGTHGFNSPESREKLYKCTKELLFDNRLLD